MVSDSVLKIARPCAFVAAVVVPLSVPDETLIVTLVPAVVTTLPYWSQNWAVTVPRLLPAVVFCGCVVNVSVDGAAGGDGEGAGPEAAESRRRGHETVGPGQVFGQQGRRRPRRLRPWSVFGRRR